MNRFCCLALLLWAGCTPGELLSGAGAQRTSDWYETGRAAKSREDLARMVRELIVRQGYPPAEFDASGQLETAWDTHYSVHFREGYRTKIEVEILPESGGFNVRVRSTMEINDNNNQCMIPAQAQWVAAGISDKQKPHIPEQAIKLHQLLKLRLFGLNP